MRKNLTVLTMVLMVTVLLAVGCKNTNDPVYEIEDEWVVTIEGNAGVDSTLNFTLADTKVYSGGMEIGIYALRLSNLNVEVDRALGDGTVVNEKYFGAFSNDDLIEGTMTRYFPNGDTINFSWKARRASSQ